MEEQRETEASRVDESIEDELCEPLLVHPAHAMRVHGQVLEVRKPVVDDIATGEERQVPIQEKKNTNDREEKAAEQHRDGQADPFAFDPGDHPADARCRRRPGRCGFEHRRHHHERSTLRRNTVFAPRGRV